MNRQVKRAMQRRQQSPDRLQAARRQQLEAKKRKPRAGVRQFLREVRQELKKVAWPSRRELFAYTIVVLFTVVVLTSFVFGLDFVIGRAVLTVFGQGS